MRKTANPILDVFSDNLKEKPGYFVLVVMLSDITLKYLAETNPKPFST
jgi:hypothetical protein